MLFLRDSVPNRRSSSVEDSRPARIERTTCIRSTQCVSISCQLIVFSPGCARGQPITLPLVTASLTAGQHPSRPAQILTVSAAIQRYCKIEVCPQTPTSVRKSQLVAGQVAEELIAGRAETGHVVVALCCVKREVAGGALVVRVAVLLLSLVVDDPGGVEEPLRVIDRVGEVRSGLVLLPGRQDVVERSAVAVQCVQARIEEAKRVTS